jgi:hypothetical protein
LKSIRQRAERIGLPFYTWAKLASLPESKLHQPQISNWLNGTPPSAVKVARLLKVLADVEDLLGPNGAAIRPDLSDADVVRLALSRLAQRRAETATAPYVGRAAASHDAKTPASASRILAEPLANKV